MDESRPPFRAAFWAISAALLLMLVLAISDPYQVRQAILARNTRATQPLPPRGDRTLIADVDRPPPTPAADESPSAARPDAVVAHVEQSPVSRVAPMAAAPTRPLMAQTQTISTGPSDPGESDPSPGHRERPAMPIMHPSDWNAPAPRGEYVELPPPPGMDSKDSRLASAPPDSAASTTSANAGDAHPCDTTLDRLQLEGDILSLRHDLREFTESLHISQWSSLQQRQLALLHQQQQSIARLHRLTDQFDQQSARLEQLLDRAAATNAALTNTAAAPPTDTASAPPRTPAQPGQQRLSLIIESDDVAEVLGQLGDWSDRGNRQQPAPVVTQSDPEAAAPQAVSPAAIPVSPATRRTSAQQGPLLAPPAHHR